MMYYIDRIEVKHLNNKKGLALKRFLKDYEQILISSREKAEKIIEIIRHKVEDLDKEFPATIPLLTMRVQDTVCCIINNPLMKMSGKKLVFSFEIKKIMRIYYE